jgi:O-antigen biosynthesis protein
MGPVSLLRVLASEMRGRVASLVPRRGDFPHYDRRRYRAWVARHDTLDAAGREALAQQLEALRAPPLISVAMATYNTPAAYLREAIGSVRSQLYPRWELCIADDASTSPDVGAILGDAARGDERIKVAYRAENGHISAALNSALALATGEFVTFLDHDDRLPETALAEVALELDRHPEADLVYSDEDKLDARGRRCDPHFKPEWNPELMGSVNYVCHLAILRRELVERVGRLREGFEGSQDYDLLLRAIAQIEDPERIRHVPRLLYHWRRHWRSTALRRASKSYALAAAHRALSERYAPERVEVGAGRVPATHRLRHPLPTPLPPVSLIVAARDGESRLRRRAESIEAMTTYSPRELLIADSESSASKNRAAREARGAVLAFVDDDLEVVTPDWLEEMAAHALRPQIGAVGAKLLDANGRIEHAGIALGILGVAGHPHRGLRGSSPGYFSRLGCTQATSAVSGACLVLRRETFEEVGGFDEEKLVGAFSDVDLCLRLRSLGYRNVWTPYAVLRYAKPSSRVDGRTASKRLPAVPAVEHMRKRWGALLLDDPYYNPNLTLESERMYVARVPRRRSRDRAPEPV